MWLVAGFFDESEYLDQAYVVAGFMGNQHDCVHLDLQWRERILKKYELDYFKASELNSGKGQFAKFRDDPKNLDALFSQREKDLFLQIKTASIDVIVEHDLIEGFGAVVMMPDYARIVEEYRVMHKTVPAPYFFCSQLCMMQAGLNMNEINATLPPFRRGEIRPIFDSHEQYSGRAKQSFDEFARKNPICSKNLLPPHFEKEQDYLTLQAADNLAYECGRLLISQEWETQIPERKAMTRLKKRVQKVFKLNYEAMKIIIESNNPDVIPIRAEIDNPPRFGAKATR